MQISVKQSGNTVEVAGYGEPILFEVEGLELTPLQDHTFAGWLVLPWTMTTGEPIEIDGPVDTLAMNNMMRFAKTWELWLPHKFHPVKTASVSIRKT